VTKSKPSDFPSLLRQKLSTVQTVERHKVQTEAWISETCEKCGRKEVRFTSVQLRSADEGATNFYTCECGHKYVLASFTSTTVLLLTGMSPGGVKTTECRSWRTNCLGHPINHECPVNMGETVLIYFFLVLVSYYCPTNCAPTSSYADAVAPAASGIRAYSVWPLCS
jgi:hypothetical protein